MTFNECSRKYNNTLAYSQNTLKQILWLSRPIKRPQVSKDAQRAWTLTNALALTSTLSYTEANTVAVSANQGPPSMLIIRLAARDLGANRE